MLNILIDLRNLLRQISQQNFAFIMACGYLFFSYLRPQAIYPVFDFLPWTQICILAGLGYQIIKGRFRIEFLHLLLFLFCCIVTFSSFHSYNSDYSFERLDVILIWFVEVLFFTNCFNKKIEVKLIFSFFFLIIFKMSFFGARTWVQRGFGFVDWGIAGPPGFFANSGELSLLLGMTTVMAIGYFSGLKEKKWYHHIFALTCIMTILAASSRGGQLALAIGLIFLAILFKKISVKYILIGSIVAFLLQNFIPDEQTQRWSEAGDDTTSQSRLAYWKAGIDMMEKNKLTGIGYFCFPQYYADYYAANQSIEGYLANRREVSHNSFVEVGSTLGYPGLFVYCWMLCYIYVLCRRAKKLVKEGDDDNYWILTTARGLQAALIVYLVGSFFMSVAFYPFVYLLLMTASVLRNAARASN